MWPTVRGLYPKWPEDRLARLQQLDIRQTLDGAIFLYFFQMRLAEVVLGFALVQAVDVSHLWV